MNVNALPISQGLESLFFTNIFNAFEWMAIVSWQESSYCLHMHPKDSPLDFQRTVCHSTWLMHVSSKPVTVNLDLTTCAMLSTTIDLSRFLKGRIRLQIQRFSFDILCKICNRITTGSQWETDRSPKSFCCRTPDQFLEVMPIKHQEGMFFSRSCIDFQHSFFQPY